VSRLGVGRRFGVQRPVVGDRGKNQRASSERGVGVGPVQTGSALDHHGNVPGRSQKPYGDRARERRVQPDRRSKHGSPSEPYLSHYTIFFF